MVTVKEVLSFNSLRIQGKILIESLAIKSYFLFRLALKSQISIIPNLKFKNLKFKNLKPKNLKFKSLMSKI